MNPKMSRPADPVAVLKRVIRYMLHYYKAPFALVVLCILINAGASVLAATFPQTLVDDYIMPMIASGSTDFSGLAAQILRLVVIMALGVGVASIRSDENAAQDSFGLVALCSVGPILAVMVLALIYPGAGVYTPVEIPSVTDSRALWHLFQVELPAYLSEVAVCLAPIALFFAVFQAVSLKLNYPQQITRR